VRVYVCACVRVFMFVCVCVCVCVGGFVILLLDFSWICQSNKTGKGNVKLLTRNLQ